MDANTVIPFLLPELPAYRATRTSRIDAVLGTSLASSNPPAEPLAYAVAHHLLEGAEQAARKRDRDLLDWYRQAHLKTFDRLRSAAAQLGAHMAINPPQDEMLQSELSDTAYYLLRPDTAPTAPIPQQLIGQALELADRTGFGDLLALHAPVICLMDGKSLDDVLYSWSITRLPGTVFTDHVDGAPEVLARDLIHEAGHHWLNEALTVNRLTLSEDMSFYSPWRETERPAFGFLHACWAFSLAVIYTTRVLPAASPTSDEFLRSFLQDQAVLLRAATPDFQRALRLVRSALLQYRMASAFLVALECTKLYGRAEQPAAAKS